MTEREQELMKQATLEVEKHQSSVQADKYRLDFHIMPPVGLLNDPNGFIDWNGTYHLFYQWNPFKTAHGAKFWGHYSSKDLVTWQSENTALAPSEWFEKNGCYSGSAIDHDGKLKLFYTGNVKDEQGNRETYQCLAESEDGITFTKKGVVLTLPKGYTAHFRDPKVWKHNDSWYMIIGAQSEQQEGKAVLFQSENLVDWQYRGAITGSHSDQLDEFGYMWECPDLFHLNGQDILIVSPQGLEPTGTYYQNTYQSGYFIGELDYETATYRHGSFTELDRGFEFYAPQTMVDRYGRRLLFAWMGVPEQYEDEHPTIDHHWIHAMTIPRELKLVGSKLYQKPVEELTNLRSEGVSYDRVTISEQGQTLAGIEGGAIELIIDDFAEHPNHFEINISETAKVVFDREQSLFTLERKKFTSDEVEVRQCALDELHSLRIYLDHSSIELFINDGEEVFTARIFPTGEQLLSFLSGQSVKCRIRKWDIHSIYK
ncbi:sucrose-6-phosphate hydrolase [Desertibacillus haloalkaliphilus]|uniref:sucrose-6-phosphate hydrolase n=1 Tax=Desertibacillus haloalkaliphilus TaxID=1328930 RepID=UPI001C275FC9|nr:sucrose-6-phosphate hydrolase [Desertibacillus haloalkaliphilus]MBU8905305.1 sucrose-6-phosphate hydrolase [Desertibacillus haloalkaliphilus]